MPVEVERRTLDIGPHTAIAGELAEAAVTGYCEHSAGELVQSLCGGVDTDLEARVINTRDRFELLDLAGDLLAEHRPEDVPDRERFDVVAFDFPSMEETGSVTIAVDEDVED